jgi:hypothetical protein
MGFDATCNSTDDESTVNELKTKRKNVKRVKREKIRRILIE